MRAKHDKPGRRRMGACWPQGHNTRHAMPCQAEDGGGRMARKRQNGRGGAASTRSTQRGCAVAEKRILIRKRTCCIRSAVYITLQGRCHRYPTPPSTAQENHRKHRSSAALAWQAGYRVYPNVPITRTCHHPRGLRMNMQWGHLRFSMLTLQDECQLAWHTYCRQQLPCTHAVVRAWAASSKYRYLSLLQKGGFPWRSRPNAGTSPISIGLAVSWGAAAAASSSHGGGPTGTKPPGKLLAVSCG